MQALLVLAHLRKNERLRATGTTNITEVIRDLPYGPFHAPIDLLGIPH